MRLPLWLALYAASTAATAPAQEAARPPAAAAPAPALKTATVPGAELRYVEAGAGEPLVLVHGELADYRAWWAQMEPLSRRFRVIAYSRRYHYPNVGGGDGLDVSYDLHTRDLLAFIQALGLGPVHLAGHSSGAAIALLAAKERPERVKSLVLAEPAPLPALFAGRPDEANAASLESKALQEVRSALGVNDAKRALRAFLDPLYGPGGLDRLPAAVRTMFEENGKPLLYRAISIPPPVRLTCADLKKVAAPVLLVQGDLGPPILRSALDILAECLPASERAPIAGAGHGLMWEKPDDWNAAVLSFLERRRQQASADGAIPGVKQVTVNGVRLSMLDIGSGEPVVLVHGELGDFRVWSDLATRLAARQRVIAYSRRHHYPGHPPEGLTEDSYTQHQRDLGALVETLGLGPVHVIGHGDGGTIAALFAQSSPQLIRSLVLVEPSLKRAPGAGTAAAREVSFRSAEFTTAVEAGWRRGGEALAVRAFVDATAGEGTFEKLSAEAKAQHLDNALTLKLKFASPPDFTCSDAARIRRPALFVRGERSPRFYQWILDAVEACWIAPERLTLPGVSHRAPFESTQAFTDAVDAFYERVRQKR